MSSKQVKSMKIFFLLDPLESLHGPLRPPFLIAKELKKHFDIAFVSPLVSKYATEVLKSQGFEILNLDKRHCFSGSLLTFEAWLRRSEFRLEHANRVVANFSQCFLADADIYYAQGPIAKALDDMCPEMKQTYRLAYRLTRAFFVKRDKSFNKELRRRSSLFIANSWFCASMYEDWGVKVDNVIYPPLDCERVKPTTSEPSGDYVLTYIGKEAKYSVLKAIADTGIKIKAFGFKAPYIPSYVLKHPNIKFLGKVSDQELVDLYSNALYTLFTFTHETFGYIPVESMACGTPVLTYNRQGPSESVVNGQTGWLVESNEELVNVAARLWRESCPQGLRENCRRRALEFDVKVIVKGWLKLIEDLFDSDLVL
jgi:glycosyltransferase involved in cell wall biosynthesis